MSPLKLLLGRPEISVVIGAALLVAFFSVGTHGAWLHSVPSVLRITAQVGIVTIGQALLMTSGEVDLSVGSTFAFAGVVFLTLLDANGFSIFPAMIASLLLVMGIGFVNGLLTTRFRVPSMIVTMGAMFILRGLTYLATKGSSLSIPRPLRHDPLVMVLKTKMFGINVTVFILLVLTVLFVFVLAKTRFGSHVAAVGGNPDAALANGVSPASVKTRAFIMCTALAGLSGILVTCQEGAIYSTSGMRMELESIAAAVIGGCTLRGGIGSIWGPVVGVFVLSSLKGGLMMMGAPTSWYIAFVGAILVGFLVVSHLIDRRLRPVS
jgi:simple sugar transport system permease protein/ribose transport system permease protein